MNWLKRVHCCVETVKAVFLLVPNKVNIYIIYKIYIYLQYLSIIECNSTKLTIYCNLSSFIEEYNNGSASCKQCGYKTSPEQIKKHKQYTQEMISTIIENRGGHPEPMEQVILSTVIVFESK